MLRTQESAGGPEFLRGTVSPCRDGRAAFGLGLFHGYALCLGHARVQADCPIRGMDPGQKVVDGYT